MAKKYFCCDTWMELIQWLDHVDVGHHYTEFLACPICSRNLEIPEIRLHLKSEHLITCPNSGCSFVSESFDDVQEHFVRSHPTTSGTVSQDGETSRRLVALLQSVNGIKTVRVTKHLVLHKIDTEDRGYGCGFRNLQTLVASLLFDPELRRASGFTATPSISQIQVDIERAWRAGFDPIGAGQLGRRLLGTRKWIGATEVATFLQYHHIKVQVVDIKLHSNKTEAQKRMVGWVKQYFQSTETALPLYFQHEGHSRTIIGVEERANGTNLLIYDPNTNPDRIKKALETASAKGLSFIRFLPSSLSHREYQIVAVRGVLPDECYEIAKDFTMFNHVAL